MPDDMRREVILRELNQGALAGLGSEVSAQAADLILAVVDRYDAWKLREVYGELVLAGRAAHRCIPNGEIRSGCVVSDGEQVRERLRKAVLAIGEVTTLITRAPELSAGVGEPAEPRTWRAGDPEPEDFPMVASPSGANEFAHREGGWFHTSGCTCCVDIPWDVLVRQCGPLTEATSTEAETT